MGTQIKMAWWKIGRGRMDKAVQEKFEKGQKLAAEMGQPVKITLTITLKPPRPKEPDFQPVVFGLSMTEPAYKSKEMDLIRRGDVAISDAEDNPDQEHLKLDGEMETKQRDLRASERTFAG